MEHHIIYIVQEYDIIFSLFLNIKKISYNYINEYNLATINVDNFSYTDFKL